MRIAYIAAGAAGMYCGSCIHDNTLAAALTARGHEVTLIPTYTPLRTDEEDVSERRIFYGAVNVYLEQKLALFRHTPRLIDRLLNGRGLLSWVSRFTASTDAHELGALTLSVLRGEEGYQAKELEKLASYLHHLQPEIVQLPNSMFLGLARRLKEVLHVPVVCNLSGEDLFLDDLIEPYRTQVMSELHRRAGDADAFLAGSRYYARFMSAYLGVPETVIHLAPFGIHLDGYPRPSEEVTPRPGPEISSSAPWRIGYFARVCPEKGLHLLVEAFCLLAQEVGRERVRLAVAGYLSPKDRDYVEALERRLREEGLEDVVRFHGELDRDGKIRFLRELDVLSVPTVYRESKGLYLLEALASGTPVVQPRHGAFPELLEATGGGLLVEPESPRALADGLRTLIEDPALRQSLAHRGQRAIFERFHDGAMADTTLEVYRGLLDR